MLSDCLVVDDGTVYGQRFSDSYDSPRPIASKIDVICDAPCWQANQLDHITWSNGVDQIPDLPMCSLNPETTPFIRWARRKFQWNINTPVFVPARGVLCVNESCVESGELIECVRGQCGGLPG